MGTHVETAFTLDSDGCLLDVNEPGGKAAPRLFIGQTLEGNQWWFRHDVDAETVRSLEAVVRQEPISDDLARPSLRADPYETLLREQAAIEKVWSGPAYCFPERVEVASEAVLIGADSRDVLRPYCSEWFEDVGDCQPFAVLLRDGCAVSLCATVRTTPRADEAGVETHPDFRGQGYATQVVATWADAVRRLGRIPLYSTSWKNEASRAVASKLGLIQYGADLHIT